MNGPKIHRWGIARVVMYDDYAEEEARRIKAEASEALLADEVVDLVVRLQAAERALDRAKLHSNDLSRRLEKADDYIHDIESEMP